MQNGSRRGTGADANRGAVGRMTLCVATWTREEANKDTKKIEGRLFGNPPGRDDPLADSTNGVGQVLIQVWRLKSNQV